MFTRSRRRDEPSGPYWRQRGWQLSAGFVAVVFVLGGTIALTAGEDRAREPAPGGPLSGRAAGGDSRPQGCRTDDGDDAVPTTAPRGVEWRTIGVVRVPVSPAAGPTRTDGGMRWCFAHTPVGAVLAAHVIPSQLSEPGWREVLDQQVVAGPGRDRFEFQRGLVRDSSARRSDGSVATYTGFSVASYEGSDATVDLLMRTGSGYATTSIDLRWSGGDWKIRPSDGGDLHTPVSVVQNPRGYVLWGR
ncbi:hypothetical protein [Streptomyces pilosus]|uniref:hypothetical protein n=1 Tax=Streptomyces pilosus TaxID=28893 RepID=UPI0036FC3D91